MTTEQQDMLRVIRDLLVAQDQRLAEIERRLAERPTGDTR
jgi:hypothetical protein